MTIKKYGYMLLACMTLAMSTVSGYATANEFPTRPITVIVPWGAGGGSDQMVRALVRSAESVSDAKFVVQNMPGASGLAGLNHVMQQPADGYMIYEMLTDQIVQMAAGMTSHRMGDSLVPLARSQAVRNFLFVRSDDDRFSSFDELVDYAKENDGQVKIGTAGIRSFDTFMLAAVENELGIKFRNVPFDNASERYAALQGGFIDVLFEQIGDVIQFVESGTFKPVLVYSAEPVKAYPDVPTTVGYNVDNVMPYTRGFLMRAGTPDEPLDYLDDLFARAMQTEEWKKFNAGQVADEDSYLGRTDFGTDLDEMYRLFSEEN